MTDPLPDILRAAEILEGGGLVAFPTDTVYGLGALTTEIDALDRIFRLKGRPRSRALIVHVDSSKAVDTFAEDVPQWARGLADAFWPGPLTMVLRKRDDVPDEVTGGGDTVALRVPNHPVALELIGELGRRRGAPVGIAAPSANRFGEPPPTSADEVVASLGGPSNDGYDLILDGGTCSSGVPSTVLSCVGAWPRILRRGGTTAEQIEAVIGRWVDQ